MKLGILGGGQLGRMLLQAAANYPLEMHVMESSEDCPARNICKHFTEGDIRNFDDVYAFGKTVDALCIEIENVNLEALERLEGEGLAVYPKPAALRIIKNKIRQKEFYKANEIPSPDFVVTNSRAELEKWESHLPGVHKLAEGGYDGRGVQIVNDALELELGFDAPSVLEKKVHILREISMIIAADNEMNLAIYDPVEMVMDPDLNQLDYQVSPAEIAEKLKWKCEAVAIKVVKGLNSPGIFAVELFIDQDDNVWVNETAPRVHNSGHHGIEACYSGQFDMLIRIMAGYPLGNPAQIMSAAIVNLVGAPGQTGSVNYVGLHDVLAMENVFVHLYGKSETKPGRKMGHATILSNEPQELTHKVRQIKATLQSVSTQSPQPSPHM